MLHEDANIGVLCVAHECIHRHIKDLLPATRATVLVHAQSVLVVVAVLRTRRARAVPIHLRTVMT